jgi:hypothetical protein
LLNYPKILTGKSLIQRACPINGDNKNKTKGSTMGKGKTVKPGETVKDSGIYQSSKSNKRATMVKGENAPPTPKKGEVWKQKVDTNKNN